VKFFEVNHYHYYPDGQGMNDKLNQILQLLQESKQREISMSKVTDALVETVTRVETVTGSVKALIAGIPAMLAEAGADAGVVSAVTAKLNVVADDLANAVVAGTPAA